jgi:hypothetical protein
MSGLRSWGPHTGVGTLENRGNPIMLMGAYTCHRRATQLFQAHVVAFATCSSPSTARASACTRLSRALAVAPLRAVLALQEEFGDDGRRDCSHEGPRSAGAATHP